MKQKQIDIWRICQQVLSSLSSSYGDEMNTAAKEFGLEPPIWYPLTAAHTFKPDPITVRRLRVRSPYSSPRYFEVPLLGLLKGDFLVESNLGGYHLTPLGDNALRAIMIAAYDAMESLPALNQNDMQMLAHSLGRIVQSCMVHGKPFSRWCIIYSRRLDEAPTSAFTAKIDQYLSDLSAFRDDAHLESWQHHGVSGHAWDVLSTVWSEGTCTLEDICNKLTRRQWKKVETEEAVDEVINRGWMTSDSNLSLTDQGVEIREEAEILTDTYFYDAWDEVSENDLESLTELLPHLNDHLLSE